MTTSPDPAVLYPDVAAKGRLSAVPDQDPDQLIASEWQCLRREAQDVNWPEYRALIEAAYAEPKLRRLYPYTSHWSLNFSTSTRLPHVNASRGGRYQVVSPRRVLIAETDTPEEALVPVLSRLPDDVGPAVPGVRLGEIHDPLWEEVERRCDPERSGASPRFWIENTSPGEWRSLSDLVSREPWPPTTPQESLWAGPLQVILHPTAPPGNSFTINLGALPAQWRMDILLDYLDHLGLEVPFPGPILMAPEGNPTQPVLAFHPLRDGRVRLLPSGGLVTD